jgi:PAS domain S-box-containing protein
MADAPQPASILVVDDDRGLLRLVEKSLRREGHTVATADSGQEAIAWLEKNRPDLMLLDLKLQDIEGREVINHLAAVGREIPFIVITGQGDERVAVEMMKRGALDYVVKDVRFQDFVPTVVQRALKQLDQQRKLAETEQALKRESAFTHAVFDASGALLMVLDADFRIVRFNPACERVSGYTLDEVRGRHVWDFLVVPSETDALKEMFGKLRAWAPAFQSENHWRTKSGERRAIAWTRTAIRAADGTLEFIVSAGVDLTERKRLEHEILQIAEREQRRIGQDLHDGLGQQLAGIEFMSQVLAQNLAAKSRPAAASAKEIAKLVRETISHTRELARGLSPVLLESEGLMLALRELAEATGKRFKVKCRFDCKTPVLLTDNPAAAHLYRIAQEAVSNALRHGKARAIDIGLASTPERITLAVHDNGVGLPDNALKKRGMGLRIMDYRAGMIGGTLVVQKRREGGTTVVCTVHRSLANHVPHPRRERY